MTNTYSFLSDDLAILEIRKHKWIESEKKGYEVGFATAAVDWVRQYGSQWRLSRFGNQPSTGQFDEKRRHRRFQVPFPVKISFPDRTVGAQTRDINLVGLSCLTTEQITDNTEAEVTIRFRKPSLLAPVPSFRFRSRVTRVTPASAQGEDGFRVFVPFSEQVWDFIRANPHLLER